MPIAKRSLHLTISLVYFTVRAVYRVVTGWADRSDNQTTPVVLTYHSIQRDDVPKFERQMCEVKRSANPIAVSELSGQQSSQAVVVTFDDGFQNVFDHAVPVLTKYQIPATCFVPTGFIGREAGWMADKRNDERCLLERLVTAQELAAVDSRWITIGSHSVNHPHLATLPQASLDRELVESKQTLERIVGRAVSTLSFPYGSFSEKVLDAAGAAGYTQVFANVPVCPAAELTPTLVGRIGVSAQDWPVEFKLKVQGGYEWLSVVIPAKRAVLRWVRWQSRP